MTDPGIAMCLRQLSEIDERLAVLERLRGAPTLSAHLDNVTVLGPALVDERRSLRKRRAAVLRKLAEIEAAERRYEELRRDFCLAADLRDEALDYGALDHCHRYRDGQFDYEAPVRARRTVRRRRSAAARRRP